MIHTIFKSEDLEFGEIRPHLAKLQVSDQSLQSLDSQLTMDWRTL